MPKNHPELLPTFALSGLLVFSFLLALSTLAQADPACGPSSSCQHRCHETLGVDEIRGDWGEERGPHLPRLRCRCDRLCFFYGDCCHDFAQVCHVNLMGRWRLAAQKKYLVCEKSNPDVASRRGLMVLGK